MGKRQRKAGRRGKEQERNGENKEGNEVKARSPAQ